MIAVCAAKFVGYVCKKMGRQGVTWAGKVAIKICPDILEQLSSQVRKAIFATCGTNGKTTTNNMLCAALEAEGQKVICNHTGSNMLNGVVAAFVLASKWNGKIVGGIYDDRLLVKPVKSAVSLMPNAIYELPYDGAKEMLLVDNVDNKDFLTRLFVAMYDELPAQKKKKS